MFKYFLPVNKWYDNLKEPYRIIIAIFITHPVWLINIFPIYGIIGLFILLPWILSRV